MTQTKLICSIGVFAYNEEKNIGKLLDALLNQKLNQVEIKEIIVVSSASTDNTDQIVSHYAQKNSLIRLIAEPERNGKSSSINRFIKESASDLLVIESADTIPESDTIEKMVRVFKNPTIGMSGGRPVPENSEDDLIGFAVNLLWKLHHKMAIYSPKLGEMVAFRKVFTEIPPQSAVDEASIEAQIRDHNLSLIYVADAIIHNKGPETVSDFIKQRRRIAAGHLWLKDNQHYTVTSSDPLLMLKLFLGECFSNPKNIVKIIATAKLEVFCRILGTVDYKYKKINPYKWTMINSSKDLNYTEKKD
jgi:cellulose synthase/poly-beta-1,6-N-acetylglucosamine synthase-like glycosyltransferase